LAICLIEHQFGKKSEYDLRRDIEKKDREEHKKKLQEAPFKSMVVVSGLFQKDKDQFGSKKQLPRKARTPSPKSKKLHDEPFRPSNPAKKGYNSTISKYPAYKPDPMREVVRSKEPETKKDVFKPPKLDTFLRPTPSISLNKFNLKKEIGFSATFL